MYCSKCGKKLHKNEEFCSKCGTKVEKDTPSDNKKTEEKVIKIKLHNALIILSFATIIIIIVLFKIFNYQDKKQTENVSLTNTTNNTNQEQNTSINTTAVKEPTEEPAFTENDLLKILKKGEMGIYLQDYTSKLGTIAKISHKKYDKLISYCGVYKNGQVILNSGGIILYNSSTKSNKILKLPTDLQSVLYYIIKNNMDEEVEKTTKVFATHIEENGQDAFSSTGKKKEAFYKLGKKIGKIVGVSLCRNIGIKGLQNLGTATPSQIHFLYKKDEISMRYMGAEVTKQVYSWPIGETQARVLYANNRQAYNNILAMYGSPYRSVKQFVVYSFSEEADDNAKEIGTYSSITEAKKKLKVEEFASESDNSESQENEKNIENDSNDESKSSDNSEENSMVGRYKCTTSGANGYLLLNNDKTFTMYLKNKTVENFTRKGTYKVNGDTLVLSVTYSSDDDSNTSYTEKLTIKENGSLKYITEYDNTIIFSK